MRSGVQQHILEVETWCESLVRSGAAPDNAFIEATVNLQALERQCFDLIEGDASKYVTVLHEIYTKAIEDRRRAIGAATRITEPSDGRLVAWRLFVTDWSHLALESGVVCEADCPFPDFWIAFAPGPDLPRIISWFPAAYVPAITHALELMPTQAAWWVNDDFEFLPPFES